MGIFRTHLKHVKNDKITDIGHKITIFFSNDQKFFDNYEFFRIFAC